MTETLEKAISGDREAICAVITHYRNMAYGLALSRMQDFHTAEDIAQESLIELYRKISDLKSPYAFSSWFRKIVLKYCDRIKRRSPSPVVEVSEEVLYRQPCCQNPSNTLERKEMNRNAFRAIEFLDEPYREAVILFYIEDFTHKEIAEFQEVPVSTIKKRLHDARIKLKDLFMKSIKNTIKNNALPESVANKIMMFPFPRYAPDVRIVDTDQEIFEVNCRDAQSMFVPFEEGVKCDWPFYDYPSRRLTGAYEMKVIASQRWGQAHLYRVWQRYTNFKSPGVEWQEAFYLVKDDAFKQVSIQKNIGGESIVSDHVWKDGDVADWEPRIINKDYSSKLNQVFGVSLVTINSTTWKTVKIVTGNAEIYAEWYVAENGRTVFFRRYNGPEWKREGSTLADLEQNHQLDYEGRIYRHWYDCTPDFVL